MGVGWEGETRGWEAGWWMGEGEKVMMKGRDVGEEGRELVGGNGKKVKRCAWRLMPSRWAQSRIEKGKKDGEAEGCWGGYWKGCADREKKRGLKEGEKHEAD